MKVTTRDEELLALLQTYGCLTTKQVQSLIFPGVALTTVLRRLRTLEEEGLVQKILGLESAERLWALTRKSTERFEFESAKLNFPRAILEHDSLLSTLRMRLEEAGIARSWIPEHAIRKRVAAKHGLKEVQRRVISDGVMSVKLGDTHHSIAIELELSNKNQERYKQIFFDYRTKKSLSAVWYIVKSKTIRKQIDEALSWVYVEGRGPKIFFSQIDDVLKDPLNAATHVGKTTRSLSEFLMTLPAHAGAHLVSGSGTEETTAEISTNPS